MLILITRHIAVINDPFRSGALSGRGGFLLRSPEIGDNHHSCSFTAFRFMKIAINHIKTHNGDIFACAICLVSIDNFSMGRGVDRKFCITLFLNIKFSSHSDVSVASTGLEPAT